MQLQSCALEPDFEILGDMTEIGEKARLLAIHQCVCELVVEQQGVV